MKDVELQSRLMRLGMPMDRAREVTRAIRDEIHPASVIASKALNVVRANPEMLAGYGCIKDCDGLAGCGCSGKGMGALGISKSGGQTMEAISAGAKIGSIVPGIGTAIGAVVGGVVMALRHVFGSHDVRVDATTKGQCKTLIDGYMQTAQQSGGVIGAAMTKDQLEQLNWCILALWGVPTYNVDPRYFQIHSQWAEAAATQIVRAVMTKPAGTVVQLTPLKGCSTTMKDCYTFTPKPFVIPTGLTIPKLAAILSDIRTQGCGCCGNKHPDQCPPLMKLPAEQQLTTDWIAFVLNRDYPPQAAAAAPPTVKATPAVVKAAGQMASAAVAAPKPTPMVMTASGPAPVAQASPGLPAVLPPQYTTPDALMAAQLSANGVNMVSPDAQEVLSDVAATGVQQTPAGPSTVTPNMASVGWIGAGLLALVFLGSVGRKSHGR